MQSTRALFASARLASRTASQRPVSSLLSPGARPSKRVLLNDLRFADSFRRCLSDDVKGKIDKAVADSPLVLFMKGTPALPQCGFSRAVCQILEVQGVDPAKIKSYNVLEDAELRDAIKEYSNWPTIPQLYLEGEFVGGCDILLSMHQSGELEPMLEKAGVVIPEVTDPEAEAPKP